jgi:hypothetical protein
MQSYLPGLLFLGLAVGSATASEYNGSASASEYKLHFSGFADPYCMAPMSDFVLQENECKDVEGYWSTIYEPNHQEGSSEGQRGKSCQAYIFEGPNCSGVTGGDIAHTSAHCWTVFDSPAYSVTLRCND